MFATFIVILEGKTVFQIEASSVVWTFFLISVTRRSRSDECDSLPESLDVSIDLTDVTLVSDDTYRRLYWCNPDDPDESYLVMKVI